MSIMWGPALDAEMAYRAEQIRAAAVPGPAAGPGARAGSHATPSRPSRRRRPWSRTLSRTS
ncbi:hypothetical protein [Cellulomonas sp. KRMCY2]|uniref:hypothetical protein n=1 Tax=Cellulomonas sp. KRMCY2 TaxID=1304865 RepID=UPI0012DD280B|nr:hypothetical protein [Cellulomonas sp. KRMCY2]